jgi:hypothetical protein
MGFLRPERNARASAHRAPRRVGGEDDRRPTTDDVVDFLTA